MYRGLDSGNFEGWWKGLNKLLSLLLVVDDQSVEVLGTSDLELGLDTLLTVWLDNGVSLDGGRLDVSSSGDLNESLNVRDLLLFVGVSKPLGGSGMH